MEGYELIADFRRNQFASFAGQDFRSACANDSDALSIAALSYRQADSPDSTPPVFWPFNLALWRPQDKLTNLMIAGVLYQETSELNEKLHHDGSRYQHAAIEVAEEINALLTSH